MKRRFTDADKWDDAWYYGLTPVAKLVFGYLCDRCDLVGVWKVNRRQAANAIGMEIDWHAVLLEFGDRIEDLGNDRWLLTGFMRFQYPKPIGARSVPHLAIRRALASYGLLERFSACLADPDHNQPPTLGEPFGKGSPRHKDKDKDRDSIFQRPREDAPDVTGDPRARDDAAEPRAAGAARPAGETSAPPPTEDTPEGGSPAVVPASAIADPEDVTTALPALAVRPTLRVIENRSPDVDVLDRLTFAGAIIPRDRQGVWVLAAKQYGIDRVLAVLAKIKATKQPAYWSTVSSWLDGGDAAIARPNDGWHYPPTVKFDEQGPHMVVDGQRVPFRPTKKLADMQREGGTRG